MIKDILYNSNILDGLFTPKDFEFLKDTNNKQEKLDFEIKMTKLKRDKIIEAINRINIEEKEIENIDTNHLKKYVDIAENAFDSVNKIIENLTQLLNKFNDIEQDIIQLVVKKESNNNVDVTQTVENINQKIIKFQIEDRKIKNENEKLNINVNAFLNQNNLNIVTKDKVERENVKLDSVNDIKDNLELIVSERQKRVYLPYTKSEIEEFLENYPDEYKTAKDVIEQEFIADISIYNKHPILARFREAYSLYRNKEMKSPIDSLKFAMDIMFRSDLNPTIIAAVKSEKQLENYIECLEKNKLEEFKYFTITFEVNPI